MLKIKTIAEALTLAGTMQESSLKNFEKFLNKPFSGNPVEACWNDTSSSYSNGKTTTTPSFQTVSYYCLRPFNNNHSNPTDAFLMNITNKSSRPETVKKFYDYLFSDESPWASAFPGLALVGEDKNGIPDAILWYDIGKSPSKVVANLFSAMRLHTCWGADWFFAKLVDAGFSPEAAILLASNFSWAGQSLTVSNGPPSKFDVDPRKKLTLSKMGCSKTDMPFSTNYNPSGFSPLFKKQPVGDTGTLKDGTPVQPNNYIWHTDAVPTNSDSLSKSSPEYVKSVIKVSKETTPIHEYLLSDKEIPKDYVQEMMANLSTNKLVEV